MSDDKPHAPDTDDWALGPEHLAAATATLAQILRMTGKLGRDPGSLFGLHALMGALLLRFSEWSTGQMVDLMQRYAADEQLVEALAEVLRREGVMGVPDAPAPGSSAN